MKMLRVIILFVIVLISLIFAVGVEEREEIGKTYYVDAANGDDKHDGLAPNRAWKSVDQVNRWEFQPGDRILFKAGEYWRGQLRPQGFGSEGKPIVIDAYGKGPKPIIDGGGVQGGVIVLHNQPYWEISNLEIMNDAPNPGDRRGIEVTASNFGTVNHIHIKNMVIHDVKGIIGHDMDAKRTAGIYIAVVSDYKVPTRFHDVLIEGNTIYNIENQGIVTSNEVKVNDYPGTEAWNKRRFTDVVIRNNTIYNISKNAMIVRLTDGGVVENNVAFKTAMATTGNTIFSRSAKDTIFQYNEGFLNMSPGRDGSMYDPDLQSPGTIWQYSYSHDNAHGLIWFCTDEKDTDIIVRYNISQNDRGILVNVNYDIGSAYIYNNVFYIDQDLSPTIIEETDKKQTYHFYNNIIYNNSPSATYKMNNNNTIRKIENNLFYGVHPVSEPDDPHKLTVDPMFVSPGSGKAGIDALNGYKLLEGSPAIKKGKIIANNGGKDFWGEPVSDSEAPNIGAYNGPGINLATAAPVLLQAIPGNEQVELKWSKTTNVSGYEVRYGTASGSYDAVVDAGNVNEWTIDGLDNQETYYFTVSAYANEKEKRLCEEGSALCRISNERSAKPSLTIEALEDAYVRGGGYADVNYGAENSLYVKRGSDASYFREAFIKFDIESNLSKSLKTAVLYFHVASNEPDASIHLFGIKDQKWREDEVTWNNKPDDSDRIELAVLSIHGTGWYSLDVTEYVNDRLTDKFISFQLADKHALNKQVVISSKESGAPAYMKIIE